MLSHEDYKELLAPHALDALETAEARALEEHLETCADCREEFDAWLETTAALAFAAETAEPSTLVRGRILEQVSQLEQPARVREGQQRGVSETVTNHTSETSSNVIPLSSAKRRAWTPAQVFGAIAASLIIAALALAVASLWQRNKAMEAEVAELSRKVAQSEQELARAREEQNPSLLRIAALAGTDQAKDARAMLTYNHQTGRAMLVADGLPPAPQGKVYQLWFIADGKPLPGGVFKTDAAGHGELRDQMPPEGRGAAVFAVTLEREGGVPKPEGKAYLQGKASS